VNQYSLFTANPGKVFFAPGLKIFLQQYRPKADRLGSRHFRRPPRFCSHYWPCARSICAKTSSTLKLEGFCRGGKSLKVATNCATNACAGTSRNARWSTKSL